MKQLPIVGGAPRGECGGSVRSKHKLRPEVGAPTEICSARGAIVGSAPRGEMLRSARSKAQASPRGRGSHTKYAVHAAPLWEPRPAAKAEVCPLRSISFAPRSGLPQKICSAGGAIVGSAIRGEWGGLPPQSTSFAPRSGLPRKYAVHAAPLWEARPAANAEVCPLKSTSFAPGSGLPHEYAVHAAGRTSRGRPSPGD